MITLLQLLHLLGEKSGEYIPPTKTTADGTDSTLVCTSFVNTNLSPTSYESACVLIEDSPTARLIGQQGFVRTSGLNKSGGVLTLAAPLSDPIPSGTTFSVYARMPALTALGGPSVQKAINTALQRFSLLDAIQFRGHDGQELYPVQGDDWDGLNRFWWFDSYRRVVGIFGPLQSGKIPPAWSGECHWIADGEQIFLAFPGAPWKSCDEFEVRVYRPANSRLYVGGQWLDMDDPSAGLELLTDGTNAHVRTLFCHAMAELYQLLSETHQGSQNVAEWLAKAKQWTASANRLKRVRTPRDPSSGTVQLRPVAVGGRW